MLVISFSLIAFGGFVVAGEEISWGQRLLNLNTPEKWAAVNTQEELTLHNHHHILHYVDHAYLALSVYGTFAWLFVFSYKRLFGQRRPHSQIANWIAMLVPSWHLMPLFIPSMMHAVGVFTTEWTYYGLGTWSETTEMLLSFGLFFYMLDVKNNIEKIVKNWISIISHEKPLINA